MVPAASTKYSIPAEGFGVRMRPVVLDDAPFITALRTLPHTLGNVGDTSSRTHDQENWIRSYLTRSDDYYFIIENSVGEAIGTVGLYEVRQTEAEWGRWIICPRWQAAALGSALLLHQIAFDHLGLTKLKSCVVSTNEKVLSFHKRFGAKHTAVENRARFISGQWVNLTWIELVADEWPNIKLRLEPLAKVACKQLHQLLSENFTGPT
jgi:RimJ/RimL family protein N-acetyltransferase